MLAHVTSINVFFFHIVHRKGKMRQTISEQNKKIMFMSLFQIFFLPFN